MKYVQLGILACLVTISGLLFAIFRQQGAATTTPELAAVESPIVVEQIEPVRFSAPIAAPAPRPNRPTRLAAVAPPNPAPTMPPAAAPAAPMVVETPVIVEPPVVAAEPTPTPAAHSLAEEVARVEHETPAPPRTVTLPAGLELSVRLSNALSTRRNQEGDSFVAELDEPLVVDGLIIANKGATVDGLVVEVRRAGRVKGLAYIACELTTLHTDDGQQVPIRTVRFEREGPETQKDDLKRVGIATGIGAVIGAIAGGGKGAAVGAATGAGAGAGTVAATRGEPVVMRPETRLSFRLDEAVSITEHP